MLVVMPNCCTLETQVISVLLCNFTNHALERGPQSYVVGNVRYTVRIDVSYMLGIAHIEVMT